MPQISRFKLSARAEQELSETFLESLVLIRDKEFARQVVADLLTPTEKVMLGKRILIAVLLQEGYSYRDVVRSLKVAPGTVNNIRLTLARSGAGFKGLVGLLGGSRVAQRERYRREDRRELIANKIYQIIDALRLPVKGSKTDMVRWRKALDKLA
ncbi:helix-turn-helix domain-containing protein [Candidatus Parcubacteria bacterium]|nr:helix-turn-helix domain-containing protein [Candidatus Parcubacteria bacterium]